MKQFHMYMYMLNMIMIMVMISVLISVAFLTLLERKFLSYIQVRKGPNKLGVSGVLQPFSDAIKLMMKEFYFISKMNFWIYMISPMFSLGLIMMMWLIYPFYSNYFLMKFGVLYLMCGLSLSVYSLLMSGWSSNSLYSFLGSIRSLAQSISYEVSLSIILIIPMFLIDSMNLNNLMYYQSINWLIIFMWPLSLMFLFSIMAELNRSPFDFSEGESELVSGFNVEYMSSGFILFFLSEYASILFLSLLFNLIFLGGNLNIIFYIKLMLMVILIIWIRGTLPRFRYDLLMYFCWLIVLPFSLNYMYIMIFYKVFILK